MRKLTEAIVRFVKREDGPTATEYAVMAGLVIVVCLGALLIVGNTSNDVFNLVGSNAGSTGP